jgi:hypothetical protein
MKQKRLTYPFVPKSANWLRAGHFWALPLSDGTFGCARVIEVPAADSGRSRVMFLAGVLHWHSSIVPTPDSIAGAQCLDQGHAHIRAITRTGGEILGFRDLAADHIEPWTFRGAHFWRNSEVYRGLVPVRAQRPEDNDLPVLSTWGYGVPCVIAEARFVEKKGLTERCT